MTLLYDIYGYNFITGSVTEAVTSQWQWYIVIILLALAVLIIVILVIVIYIRKRNAQKNKISTSQEHLNNGGM